MGTGISSWLLVLASIDKFITIVFPNLKKLNTNVEILILVVFNLVYLSPYAILCENNLMMKQYCNGTNINETLKSPTTNGTNITLTIECPYPEFYKYIELVISILIPFIAMLIFTSLLVRVIFQTRLKILNVNNRRDRNRLKKDIQFAITNISLNVLFICLDLPYFIIRILKMSTDILNNFHSFSFCMSFYILFITNSIFRHEILKMFGLKKTGPRIKNTNQTNSCDRNAIELTVF